MFDQTLFEMDLFVGPVLEEEVGVVRLPGHRPAQDLIQIPCRDTELLIEERRRRERGPIRKALVQNAPLFLRQTCLYATGEPLRGRSALPPTQ